MPRYACPICHDPNAYPIWIGSEPPLGCPDDESWHQGGPVTVKTITECRVQMGKAKQRAEWMKASPESFDETGKLRDGQLAAVLIAWQEQYGPQPLIL